MATTSESYCTGKQLTSERMLAVKDLGAVNAIWMPMTMN